MFSASRSARGAAPRAVCRNLVQRRGLAAPASGSFHYQTGEASGVKFASRDFAGPTTTLALVSRAGTRYQPLPGLTEGLANFAFRNTQRRSTLRIIRESELFGAELKAYHTRENLVLEAKFLRDDLPYFVELLGEVASKSKYEAYVYNEEVVPLIQFAHKKFLASPTDMAVNSAHSLAFHSGLGNTTASASTIPYTQYLSPEAIEGYAQVAYAKDNFAVVANGVDHAEFSTYVPQYFAETPNQASGPFLLNTEQTKYYGGQERIAHGSGNAMVIAFPGSSSFTGKFYKPEIAVLGSLLGGQSAIKWSPGFTILGQAKASPSTFASTTSAVYSDAGLLYTTIKGSAYNVAKTAEQAVEAIRKIASGEITKEQVQKAKATAKFKELEHGQEIEAGLELTGAGLVSGGKAYQIDEVAKLIDGVTEEQVKAAAKSLLENKASVSAVGDLWQLPYAEDLGLKV